ncbi:MAG: bifunctional [glutamate--ammonia ligase]-adenylyl-L-tyrosine phosphorylase/[glutamate--ammonia-ligase] adenylyltransferase [Nitrospirota bacterium]|nr:bifunctional [glutamate--ammonia ligase]-adenylyl-L-tyrosine phosphorylase/[glutamate--ammonia-ligase] adenylyltransferase [Nitrospirota bacterium]
MIDSRLKDAARATPDPERSLKNLSSFLEENPSGKDDLNTHAREVSLLFSISQFLANYSISNPDVLFEVLKTLDTASDKTDLSSALREKLLAGHEETHRSSTPFYMKTVREFKTKEMLKITLRDILKKADIVDIMLEISSLADVIIENSLELVRKSLTEIYGAPQDDAFSVIALGKLGAEELNFSSDVDLIFVYGTEVGETAGAQTNQGVTVNRITNHEYYCKVGEELTRFLSLNTESGFAYRVDLRLRPEGQRGDIALALRGYEMYYESWGRAWERAMLLRARHVAGDRELGDGFMKMITPFVYRKYLDFSSIDEIKKLKTRIDSTFKKGDIKRGYGGIREIEFFAQALQLIYGGREPLLREKSLLRVMHRLLLKGLIGQEDYFILSDNYRFLRTLEHRLQQLNDLQTHTIPSGDAELNALAGKMGFSGRKPFLDSLEKRRAKVRSIYDSLFSAQKEEPSISGALFAEEFPDSELKEYLGEAGLKDVDKAFRNVQLIKDSVFTFQTLRGRRLLSEIIPVFVDSSLKTNSPDAALNHLQSFANLLSVNESYLELFRKNRELIDLLTYVFSQSTYLSKLLMNKPQHLEMIGWERRPRKTLVELIREIRAGVFEGHSLNDSVRQVKQIEEIRLGMLFLQKKIGIQEVVRGLSKAAEAVLYSCIENISEGEAGMAVLAFGKLGGREVTFSSDLDIIFVSSGEVREAYTKTAQRLLRMLISYTRDGIAYSVDTRLRPEGTKGPLVSSIESFRNYYAKAAAFWEFQALLKARPVAGDKQTGALFMKMAAETLAARGSEVRAADILQMRERIQRELSKETGGYDVKLGPGGIEEIEFAVQFLQLKNCRTNKRLLVQGTLVALERLRAAGSIDAETKDALREAYLFSRGLESFLRLSGESILKRDADMLKNASEFMGFESAENLTETLQRYREKTQQAIDRYLTDS